MKRKQFTESQIVSALKQQEGGNPVKHIARDLGTSEATFYNWKSKYGGMEASDVKRLKDLEAEHAELKKMYDELKNRKTLIDRGLVLGEAYRCILFKACGGE